MKKSEVDVEKMKADLAEVLGRHGVYISFSCSECSDTHGLSGDQLIIVDSKTGKTLVQSGSWEINSCDLEPE
jgi:hypothetical protein